MKESSGCARFDRPSGLVSARSEAEIGTASLAEASPMRNERSSWIEDRTYMRCLEPGHRSVTFLRSDCSRRGTDRACSLDCPQLRPHLRLPMGQTQVQDGNDEQIEQRRGEKT